MNSTWTELQIYYHDENKDQIILDLLRPLMTWLEPQVERVFFVRHWQRGSHLRLRVLCDPKNFTEIIQSEIESRVTAYLQAHPSRQILNESKLLTIHKRLARDEMENGVLTPFYPNNTWQFVQYDRRTHLMPESVASLIETFYSQTNDLVFDMLEQVRSGRDRVNLALDLMIATLQATSPDIVSRFISYRSHAEVFIVNTDDDIMTRDRFNRTYQANSATLLTRLDQILTGIATSQETVPFLMAWTQLIAQYSKEIQTKLTTGEIYLEPYQADAQRSAEYLQGEARLRKSPFHAMQLDDKANMEARSRDAGFNTFRLLVNLQYLHLNRIGLRPFERSLLAYLIANTVETRFEVSAYDLAQTHTYTRSVIGGRQ
jgi:hypothetical protein